MDATVREKAFRFAIELDERRAEENGEWPSIEETIALAAKIEAYLVGPQSGSASPKLTPYNPDAKSFMTR